MKLILGLLIVALPAFAQALSKPSADEVRILEIFSTIYKDSKVANRIQTIRFVRPDVAIVDLETEVTGFQGLPSGVKGAGQNKLLTSMLQVMIKDRGKWTLPLFIT